MDLMEILKYGSSVLRKEAFDIDGHDNFLKLSEDMLFTLKKSNGIGLAGPQVGVLKNIFIIGID